jgi:tyrosine-protein phosphatase SIW14
MRYLRQRWRWLASILLGMCCILAISAYGWSQKRAYRNVRVVKPGVLYRSGQLSEKGLQRILHELNIGTLVNLRGRDHSARANTTEWESALCEKNYVTFVSIPLGSPEHPWRVTPEESRRVIDAGVRQFLEVLDDPERYPRPILVHCLGGVHRTGVMCALYRMECEGWTRERAIEEMSRLGYHPASGFDPLREYIENWAPRRRPYLPVGAGEAGRER